MSLGFRQQLQGIFHEALDQFFKLLIMNQRNLSELTDQEVNLLAEEVLNSILGDARFSVLTTSSRMNYIRYQLSQTIKKSVGAETSKPTKWHDDCSNGSVIWPNCR